ncbi:MAG: COX15/CtaA family protein [Anaerolineales bacterium]
MSAIFIPLDRKGVLLNKTSALLSYRARKQGASGAVQNIVLAILIIVGAQITLGVLVIWFHVPISLALIHQAIAMTLFLAVVFLNYRLFSLAPQ